jgi:hypothetical protein
LFSPAVDGLYGNADPTRVSWAADKKKAVVEGEAEPMNGDRRMFGDRKESQVCVLAVGVL